MHKLTYLDYAIEASQNTKLDPVDFLEAQMHFLTKCARTDDLSVEERGRQLEALLESASAYSEFLMPMPVTEEPPFEPDSVETMVEMPPAKEEQAPPGFGQKLWDEMVNKFKGLG